MKKTLLVLTLAIFMMMLLSSCNNNVSETNQFESTNIHGETVFFNNIEDFVEWSLRADRMTSRTSNIVRAEVLSERVDYIDRRGNGNNEPVIFSTIKISEVFHGSVEPNSVGCVGQIPMIGVSSLPVGEDLILFLSFHEGFGAFELTSHFQAAYHVTSDLHRSPSILGAARARMISDDLTLPGVSLHNELILTVGDLVRIYEGWFSYHTLTFNLNGGSPAIAPIEILGNTLILDFLNTYHDTFSTTIPTKEGYEFIGWYFDADFLAPLAERHWMPEHDIALYARWEQDESTIIPSHTLTFNLASTPSNPAIPTAITPIDIPEDAIILDFLNTYHDTFSATTPTRYGYIFAGWYLDPALTTPLTTTTRMPARDIILHARWQPDTPPNITITFNADTQGTLEGGQAVITQEIVSGHNITQVPQVIANTGWEFVGWLRGGIGELISSAQVMTLTLNNNTTFTAQFAEQSEPVPPGYVMITFNSGYGIFENNETVITMIIPSGSTVPYVPYPQVPDHLIGTGIFFEHWTLEGEHSGEQFWYWDIEAMTFTENTAFESYFRWGVPFRHTDY